MNSRLQLARLRADYPGRRLAALLGGRITGILLLTGVDDVVQHVGAARYVRDVHALAAYVAPIAPVQVVELPMVSTSPPARLPQRAARWVGRLVNDGGRGDVIPAYRAALARSSPDFGIIDYDGFSGGPPADLARYMPDGIHLTLDGFHAYGAYLGRMMALPAASYG